MFDRKAVVWYVEHLYISCSFWAMHEGEEEEVIVVVVEEEKEEEEEEESYKEGEEYN